MPSQEGILLVVFVAIAGNLLLAIGLLVAPRLRRSRAQEPAFDAHTVLGSRDSMMIAKRAPTEAWAAPTALDTPGIPVMSAIPRAIAAAPIPIDPATGLELETTWSRRLAEEDARVRRYHRPSTVVLVEIEGYDRLVARLGPAAAERLIPPVAATMRRQARATDHVARLGPARFGAIMPETDEVEAIHYVERVRSTCDLWLEAGAVSLRLSIGWAGTNPSRPIEQALNLAEERLNEERRRLRASAPEPSVPDMMETAPQAS
jgi:diguanylate cyclase (GGDEF)-like protein